MYTNTSASTPASLDPHLRAEVLDALEEVYYFLSPEGDLLQWNDRVTEVTGYADEEVEGMNAAEFFPADHRDRVVEAVATVAAEERKVTVEADYLTKDGRRLPYEFSGSPVFEDGTLSGVIGIGRDVSERRRRERLMETVTNNVPIVLFGVDPDGVFTLARGQGLEALDLEGEELVGHTVDEVYADTPAVGENIERALAGERLRDTIEVDGRTFDTWYRPVVRGGDVEGVVGVSMDVTDRQTYEDRLEDTNERLEVLNRMVRHDIRNDLAVLLPWAKAVRGQVDDETNVERVIDAAEHIKQLTETAQEYVDVVTGNKTVDPEPTALEPVLREEIRLRRSMYESAEFRVVETIPDVSVAANELLPTVFRNLLNNAVQHNDTDSPTVTVRVTEVEESVCIDVADDGPGVADDRTEEIFGKRERFTDGSGSGIGLHLVYTLVDRYGGEVWVEDNDPRGAVFRVKLPAA